MDKILITGISGFVGINLAEYLKSQFEIIGVSRFSNKDFITYDELTVNKMNNSKAIVHLAGKAHDLKNTSEDREYYKVNTELTKKIFDKFLDSSCEVFVYMSSVKAVADKVDGELDEDCVPNPITVYGKSKLKAEEYILSKKLTGNKRVYILRPCMIHGPNNKGNLNLLYDFVAKGIPYPFGSYKNKRSFVSIDNLCYVIKSFINEPTITNGIYNIADDESLSTSQLVSLIGNSINKKVRIINLPKFIVLFIAKLGDLLPIPINSERLQKLTENYKVSNKKVKKVLPNNLPLSSREGLEKTIKSFI